MERIGSKTNAIQGVIDNVEVSETKAFEDVYHKENWNGTTNTETIYNDTEGKLIYAFDNKANTIWHSNWQGASDKLNGSNSFYAEINLGKSYEINQFSFTPRSDAVSGYVTKADLYIKNKASDEWKLVAENKVFDVNANKKTFIFDEQEVQYIKFVAKASNDGWVAVSEFDIANKPEQMFTVYVDTTDGGSVSGGKDVRKGEEVTVTATPNKGYSFDGWYNSLGNKVSESVTYTFNVASNTSLTAKFIKVGVPEANKSELQNLYNENKDRLEEIYTSESWVSFKAELDNSMVVLENKEATQEVVDEALNKLTNVNISERIREIATIKVLGFYDKEVSAYIYRENVILTIFGILFGSVLGIFLHRFIMLTVEIDNMMFGRNIDLPSYILSALLTVVFAVLVNIVMYYKLKNVKMVESLKSVD